MSQKSTEIQYKGKSIVLELGTPLFVLESQATDGYEVTRVTEFRGKRVSAPCVYDDWGNAHWDLKESDFGKKAFLSEKDVRAFLYDSKSAAEKIGYHSANVSTCAFEMSNKSSEIEYDKEAEANKQCILDNIAEIRAELDKIEALLPIVESFDMRTKAEKRKANQK